MIELGKLKTFLKNEDTKYDAKIKTLTSQILKSKILKNNNFE